MKLLSIIVLSFLSISCFSQKDSLSSPLKSNLTISKYVDQEDSINRAIITTLDDFLVLRDLNQFKHWLDSDYKKYKYPFLDLFRVEYKNGTPDFFNGNLLEIIEIEKDKDYLVKIAFVGADSTGSSQLKSIYNILATLQSDKVVFSRSLNYYIKNWQKIERYPITYYISPNKTVNKQEIVKQLQDIKVLNNYFETDSITFTYYSCVSPVELFQIKGFDYVHGMYQNKKGGLAEYGNHLFSGNKSEYYTHEIVHIYVNNLFPGSNSLLNEGIAMYFGGSGGHTYSWHKNKLEKYIENNEDFNFLEFMGAFEQKYIDKQTSIPYMTGALIYEYVINKYDKFTYFELLKERKDIWDILKTVELTEENLNQKILNTLKNN